MKKHRWLVALMVAFLSLQPLSAKAQDAREVAVTIKDHVFTPDVITAKAGEKLTLNIKNEDASVEEFESHDLKREKIIPAGGTVKINVEPLKVGTYNFVGEFHEDKAKGKIVVE
jgi:plastocyanin